MFQDITIVVLVWIFVGVIVAVVVGRAIFFRETRSPRQPVTPVTHLVPTPPGIAPGHERYRAPDMKSSPKIMP